MKREMVPHQYQSMHERQTINKSHSKMSTGVEEQCNREDSVKSSAVYKGYGAHNFSLLEVNGAFVTFQQQFRRNVESHVLHL